MAWIKRNLFFVISIAVGLLLTGYCGYLLYGSLDANSGVGEEYKNTLGQLEQFQQKPIFPSKENIQAAKADSARVSQFLAEFRKKFAPFPTPPVKDDKGFNTYLGECIDRFRVEATNAGVQLPPEFGFSFSSLRGKLNYPPGHIALWMRQLQEISAILNILYNAKINYLWNLCRVPAQGEDGGGDCLLQTATVTNQWGVVTPYKITFRGFSSEVAAVMEGFARSSNCFIIKTIDVSPDLSVQPIAVQTPAQSAAPAYAAPPRNPSPVRNQSDHHRGPPEMRPPPGAAPQEPSAPATAAAVTAPPVLFLSENALLVTISVDVVKLKASDR